MIRTIIAFQTFLMGIYILFFDNYLYEEFEIGNILDNKNWGVIVTLASIFVFVGEIKKMNNKIKTVGIVILATIWSFFFGVFLYEQIIGNDNMEWILTSGLVITLFYLAWRNEYGS